MQAYMIAEVHRFAMAKWIEWCDEASVVPGTRQSRSMSWDVAEQWMTRHGTFTPDIPPRAHRQSDLAF